MSRTSIILGTLTILVFLAPLVAAQGVDLYVQPVTENAEKIQGLFNLTLAIGTVVFLFVMGLLFFTIWKARKNTEPKPTVGHRGHIGAEITWTAIPAITLLILGGVSAATLFELDTIPDDVTTTVKVEMFQWGFRFEYPDGNSTFNTLYIEEGQRVKLEITSRDVIHALWIPEFGIKLDGVPGRINNAWFDAPAPGDYFLQCAEYCYTGHHSMHGNVLVFAKDTQPLPYGKAPKVVETPPAEQPATNSSA